jgi:hypothetical protein
VDRRRGLVPFAGIGAEVFSELVGHADKSVGIGRCRLLPRYVRPNCRILAVEVEPLFEAGFGVWLYCVHRAFRLANAAIDAFVGMDDEHVLALVEAVHRADLNAVGVFAPNTSFVDDVRHMASLQQTRTSRSRQNSKARI